MIKRVIFDIDNTLIPWEKEYDLEINKALEELKIQYTDKDIKEISQAFEKYEEKYYIFNKELMLEFINQYTGKNYPKEFIYNIITRWGKCVPNNIEEETVKILEYLKSRYELVILTDWYATQQSKRLEKLGILKYFSKVYSAEKTKRKPFKEAFMQAVGENRPEECIMIGDNLERDINGAINAGLQAIYYTPNTLNNNGIAKGKKYYKISKFEELEEIL